MVLTSPPLEIYPKLRPWSYAMSNVRDIRSTYVMYYYIGRYLYADDCSGDGWRLTVATVATTTGGRPADALSVLIPCLRVRSRSVNAPQIKTHNIIICICNCVYIYVHTTYSAAPAMHAYIYIYIIHVVGAIVAAARAALSPGIRAVSGARYAFVVHTAQQQQFNSRPSSKAHSMRCEARR